MQYARKLRKLKIRRRSGPSLCRGNWVCLQCRVPSGLADRLTGRCSFEAGKRHVDARNVIWLGTSNIGHELVFEHHENRAEPDKRMSREEYLELTSMLRPRVSHCLGV